jgi:hypothetical protein
MAADHHRPGRRIARSPSYPNVAKRGRAWVQAGRYWIAYVTRPSSAIVAVVYDAADIPGRV